MGHNSMVSLLSALVSGALAAVILFLLDTRKKKKR